MLKFFALSFSTGTTLHCPLKTDPVQNADAAVVSCCGVSACILADQAANLG